jgi:uncharacterized protein (DUF342 family)
VSEKKRQVTVQVSPDAMKVYVIVPRDDENPVTLEEAAEAVRACGVVFGLDMNALERAVDNPATRVQVASGKPPENGEDSSCKIEFQQPVGRPAELADGRADFYDLHLVTNVKKGDLLATRIPPTPGRDGTNVLGAAVPARPGRLVALPKGNNTVISDSGDELYAAIDGQALVDRTGKIVVSPVYTVDGDVDFSTGNVDFVGSVRVKDSIRSGFSVKAAANVEIGGSCEGLLVSAGQDVIVRGGIQGGRRQGKVTAGRDILGKFAENAVMEAGRDVVVGEAILHSTVRAGRKVVVRGRRGLISGGTITAGDEVSARVIGSNLATPTEIQVGVDPSVREGLEQATSETERLKSELRQVELALKKLKEMEQLGLPPDKKALVPVLTRQRNLLVGEVQRRSEDARGFQEQLKSQRKGKIRAELIYPGVKVTIGEAVLFVKDEMRDVVLGLDEVGEIRVKG